VQVQHNQADLHTWEEVEYDLVYTKMDRHCRHDSFLQALCDAVKDAAEEKLRNAGIDPEQIKQRAASDRT
jgi:putative hydrolase of HD superfamily